MLEQPEQLVDGGEDGRGRPEHGRGRGRRGRGVVLPAVLREQLVHQAPEQRVEREVSLRRTPQHGQRASRRRRPGSGRNRREEGGSRGRPTLKSSRSRVRGSAAAGSAGVGMAGGGDLGGGSLPFSPPRRGVGMECRRCPLPFVRSGGGGGRDEKCKNGTGRDGGRCGEGERNGSRTSCTLKPATALLQRYTRWAPPFRVLDFFPPSFDFITGFLSSEKHM